MNEAIASNWVAETCEATQTGFKLKGSSRGYTSFQRAFAGNTKVFYSVHDDNGNREAGYATFNGLDIENRQATATLYNGVYQDKSPQKIPFTGTLTIACTFNAFAFNALWKALNSLSSDGIIEIPPELIDGLGDSLRSKAEKVDLDKEIEDRKDGDKALQDQIDNIDVSGGDVDWGSVTGKPSTFPPSAHNHDGDYLKAETDPTVPAHVKGITEQNIADWNAGGSGGPSYDDTGIKADLATETQARIDGDAALDLRIDAVEGSISGGGGFVDAPNDGKLYGRQSENWEEVPDGGVSDWADIENKPTEFPPSSHAHAWGDVTGKPTEFPPADHDQPWSTITDKPAKFPPTDHTHDYLSDAPDDGAQYARQSVNNKMVWSAVSGESLVHVDDDAPENPATGQLWFDTDNGTLNLFDGDDWINIATGSKTIFTLPVSSRSGVVQLPVSEDADSLPVSLRSGEFAIPLNQSGDILAVNTRGGDIQLPLAS